MVYNPEHQPRSAGGRSDRRMGFIVSLPRTAYILLWFPKPSETFIFREVVNIRAMGLPVTVFTLYDIWKRSLSPEMQSYGGPIERLGVKSVKTLIAAVNRRRRKNPDAVKRLFREIPVRRWRSFEAGGENLWSFLCGFYLAERFEAEGIELIHAPWANGPATAAWTASRLTEIPFAFTARAGDIYPPDGALEDKLAAAAFVRTNTQANVAYLKGFLDGDESKLHLTYNGFPIKDFREAPVRMQSPYRLLALGRFTKKKGYENLIRAVRLLKDRGVDCRVTLAGSGARKLLYKALAVRFGVSERIEFPGFVSHDRVTELFEQSDVFVMPSLISTSGDRDGIPNVIMEALLHRVPVVASAVSGIGEVIEHERTGVLVESGNPDALASGIKRMLDDREFAVETAEQGKARVLRQFDPQANHRALVELYSTWDRATER